MNAVEFDTVIEDGKIDIPYKYQKALSSAVRVILLQSESSTKPAKLVASARKKQGNPKTEEKMRSSLDYINPEYLVETPEEIERRKKRQSIPPEASIAAFKQFWKAWDAVEDEPLGEKFDKAISAPWVFRSKVDL
ncbi:MAG: hypothetical protein LBD20_03815 [Spirochaetaceae bacterium]|jgi:hypothetical protein|nr:hypothetical protein [Spirochaetaceae bacterium]